MKLEPVTHLTARDLREVFDNEIEKEEAEDLAKVLNKGLLKRPRDIEDAMREAGKFGHGVEGIDDPTRDARYWGSTQALYVNVGDPYVLTLFYDIDDKAFYLTDLGEYLEEKEARFWEIPYTIEYEEGSVTQHKVWIRAENLEDAVEFLAESLINQGEEEIWGDDPDFDLGSVDTAVGKSQVGPLYEDQMWQITGVDSLQEFTEEEFDAGEGILSKVLRIHPSRAKSVLYEDVRDIDRLYEVEE